MSETDLYNVQRLGHQLAKELACRGCSVIIADKVDARRTVEDLIKETHNPKISYRIVDFGSFASVRKFAENLKNDIDQLDILCNNAGTGILTNDLTEDGVQSMMQINYFSHFLLTHLLLDLLLKSTQGRIVHTSSMAAYLEDLSEENLSFRTYSYKTPLCLAAYGNSKLALAIMSKILSEKLRDTRITSNCLHPGIVKTKIYGCTFSNKIVTGYLLWVWAMLFGKNIEEGVQTMLNLACADELETISGEFFMECRSVLQPSKVYDKKFCTAIWNLSEKYVNLQESEKIEAVINRSIGYQTALQLASKMWTILIADKYELEDTKHEIITRTANCKIFTYYLDLGCFSSVRTFANSIKKEHKKIDVLINNAGIFKALEETTVDNLNPIWQINHLGPFLLTVLLADLLKRAAPSRVIFMASSGAFFHTLDRNTIPDLRSRDASNILEPARTYYNSKLYNMIVCKELSQKMGKHNVTSNCLHPGMTNSGLLLNGFNLQCFRPIAHKLVSLFTQVKI
ncbi:hypothetical protein YQE_09438, partial [Dendroctonus ponderosae]